MAYLQIASITTNKFADTFIQGFEPGAERYPSDSCIAQYIDIWHQFNKAETPPEGRIQQGNRAISSIHGSNHKHVARYPKWLASQRKLNWLTALVLFKHCEQLAEDAGNIAPVNFVDDQIEP